MQMRRFDLADLLTAGGSAMGAANQRLRLGGAPALLREFTLGLDFQAAFHLPRGDCTVVFGKVSRPNAQSTALFKSASSNVRVEATFIAAPSLVPAGDAGGVVDL